jgi:hypothetical protein
MAYLISEMLEDLKMRYQIRVQGRLDRHWNDWFEGMEIKHEGDQTLLTGTVPDQAALHGLLHRIRDLNLILLSVYLITPETAKKR